jgi:hypothetical protein
MTDIFCGIRWSVDKSLLASPVLHWGEAWDLRTLAFALRRTELRRPSESIGLHKFERPGLPSRKNSRSIGSRWSPAMLEIACYMLASAAGQLVIIRLSC